MKIERTISLGPLCALASSEMWLTQLPWDYFFGSYCWTVITTLKCHYWCTIVTMLILHCRWVQGISEWENLCCLPTSLCNLRNKVSAIQEALLGAWRITFSQYRVSELTRLLQERTHNSQNMSSFTFTNNWKTSSSLIFPTLTGPIDGMWSPRAIHSFFLHTIHTVLSFLLWYWWYRNIKLYYLHNIISQTLVSGAFYC